MFVDKMLKPYSYHSLFWSTTIML